MGKTVLISSHILSELADCCNSIGIMERGELLAAGPIAEILEVMSDHRDITVNILSRPHEADQWLGHHPKVRGVERDGASIRFEFSGSDEDLADVSDELFRKGHRPLWIQENRPSLESIFMKVTKGHVQ